MANTNLKPRRARVEECTRISVALEQAPASNDPQEQRKRVTFPWMQVTDDMLEQLGFLPGERVMFSIDHRHAQILITLDRDYTIGGKPMTPEQLRKRDRATPD
ncbi:hypothetical protein A6V36_35705 [Paraburkholderia ginsengiterrae]|uniref:Uncharacterized protein n=1 Tax=Paraburkholderia ginsengiterrae TaxID=1462993 RepID=A0A1A9MZZ1_9BURK|nr:hypothetical protein [Paraburkholderia ginsengiterrae]OAJ53704.1 hypothetical protein A6V37_35340 [Paraburkholderia ginsengiterrae]OAJ54714.1 hypothetical protein A6V36_35705 [Paraburkholderia ginsengiterrae]